MLATTTHVPILVQPIIEALCGAARTGGSRPSLILDATLGGGGHTGELLKVIESSGMSDIRVLSTDRDPQAVERARERFGAEIRRGRLEVVHACFSELPDLIKAREGLDFSAMMADLGVSSDQLDQGERGLSFMRDGPLDMRMDPSRGFSARDWLLQATEREIADTLYQLGEERNSRRIASAIVAARRAKELPDTTSGLSALIVRAQPPNERHGRIHAATRSFQAIRMLVNDELGELSALLRQVAPLLKVGGVAAFLTFHSLEDRPVKKWSKETPEFEPVTKKPIVPSDDEISRNPRARSAKLRITQRV